MPNPGAGCVTGAHGVIVPVTSNLKSCTPRGAGVGWLRCPSVRGTSPGQCIQDFGPGVCGADGLGEGDPDGDPDAEVDGDGLGAIVGGAIRAFAATVPTATVALRHAPATSRPRMVLFTRTPRRVRADPPPAAVPPREAGHRRTRRAGARAGTGSARRTGPSAHAACTRSCARSARAVPTRWRRCGRWRAARRSPVRAG